MVKSQEPELRLAHRFALCNIHASQPFITSLVAVKASAIIFEHFYLHSFDILYPQINWAGNSPGYVGTEFPTFASSVYLFFDVKDWIGRFDSIIFSGLSHQPGGAARLFLTRHQSWWCSSRQKSCWSYFDSRYLRVRDTADSDPRI